MRGLKGLLLTYLLGGLIFTLGDVTSQLFSHHINWVRVLGMMFIGSTLYPLEIDNYFKFLATWERDKPLLARWLWEQASSSYRLNWAGRTLGAILFFNPLWIARHFLFIKAFEGGIPCHGLLSCTSTCFHMFLGLTVGAAKSFIYGLPLVLVGNYVVQGVLPLRYRFIGSAVLSLLFAIYYGVSAWLFG